MFFNNADVSQTNSKKLAMTGAIRGTNTERLYQDLGLESLQNKPKLRRLCLFEKIYEDHTPPYLHNFPKIFKVSIP